MDKRDSYGYATYKRPKCQDFCIDFVGRSASGLAGGLLGALIGTVGGAVLGGRQVAARSRWSRESRFADCPTL
jgi:hypothetical protein